MKTRKEIRKVCSRGHVFYKSSDCPVCPQCWSGYYRKQSQGDFPEKISAPALRALLSANIKSLSQLTKFTETQLLALHGMGPTTIVKLRVALKSKGLAFKK
jgi:hypothetical protein